MLWQIKVWDAQGNQKPTINVNHAIASLDRFDVDGAGNCLEAEFQAIPAHVGIRARDVIELGFILEGGGLVVPAYRGVIVVAGAERSRSPRPFKAVGLKQRFYEVPLTIPLVPGDDVATMVWTTLDHLLATNELPVGVEHRLPPHLGFQLGDRFPQLESVGEFLDALAETVGSFIVPDGETYLYDGRTYTAGELVPAVQWGVTPTGRFFFERPHGTALEVSEDEPGAHVNWSDVVAEEVFDRVTLVYASEYNQPLRWVRPESPPVAQPIHFTFEQPGGAEYGANRQVVLENPVDYMRVADFTVGDLPPDFVSMLGLWHSRENAHDGDFDSYAYANDPDEATPWTGHIMTIETAEPDVILRMKVRAGIIEEDIDSPNIRVQARWESPSPNPPENYLWARADFTIPSEDDPEDRELFITLPRPAFKANDITHLRVFITSGKNASRIYEVVPYVIDEAVARRLAQTYLQPPQADPAEVIVQGESALQVDAVENLLVIPPAVRITPVSGSTTEVPTRRVEYSLTTSEGLRVTYHLGQAYDAAEESQRAVLEGLAGRVAKRVTRS